MSNHRVTVTTFGCRVNQYETEAMRRALGTSTSSAADAAEIHILNGCSVTALAEKKARQTARRLRRANPDVRIVLTGCLADAVQRGLTRFDEADLIAGNAWKPRIVEALDALLNGAHGSLPASTPAPLDSERSDGPRDRLRAFLKVQDGCSGVCTYCQPTQLRGPSRSKSIAAATNEVRHLLDLGFPEIVITGINLAEYAAVDGDLADLVATLLRLDRLRRLRIASINPAGLTARLIETFRGDPRACRHFHVPLQSGSDRVLRAMARPTSTAQYLDRIAAVRDILPDATFGTDIIVGFPGEMEADFEATCSVLEQVGFVNLHAFRYSARPGTAAKRLSPPIAERVKRRRAEELDRRWRASRQPLLDARIGSTEDVLVEACREGRGHGYTPDYLYVSFTSHEKIPIGCTRPVRITEATAAGLEGVDEHAIDLG
jgi:threonylcarbamoyladenosine tRNA methylthiotransferase MtaB